MASRVQKAKAEPTRRTLPEKWSHTPQFCEDKTVMATLQSATRHGGSARRMQMGPRRGELQYDLPK